MASMTAITADQQTEITYMTGITAGGTVAAKSFWTWNDDNPATYGNNQYEAKWGAATAGTGGTIAYAFDSASNWTTTEKNAFRATMDLWSDIANVKFVESASVSSSSGLVISRASDGTASGGITRLYTGTTGTTTLGRAVAGEIDIDTSKSGFGPLGSSFSNYGGYPWTTLIHEFGHVLGLGHSGAYNDGTTTVTDPLTSYDSRQYSVMSYIDPSNVSWGSTLSSNNSYYGNEPTTWMPLDVLAIQRIYGAATSSPLSSGGQTFGFNTNITGDTAKFFDFTINTQPIVTLWDGGGGNTLDLSGYATASTVDLHDGHFSSVAGLTNNLAIAFGTAIDTLQLGDGADSAVANDDGDRIFGNGGNDVLTGGRGNDVLDGGAGTDTAILNETLGQTTISRTGLTNLTISGPDGTDHLVSIEVLHFTDGTIQLDDGSPLVDDLFYDQHNPDVYRAGVDPDAHYAQFGWHEGRDPDAYFSTIGYEAANSDVRAAGLNPLQHYDQYGWHEGRDPSANFDTTLYLLHNPDVAAAGVDPLLHYLTFGQAEGRQAYAAIGTHIYADGFDPEYYLLSNPDVAAAAIASGQNADTFAYNHYETVGWKEGRNPNAWFDDAGYLAAYADVKAAGVDPLDQYDQFGWKEGRDPSANFDTDAYLAHYTDVAAAHIDPLVHYLEHGAYELRSTFGDGAFH